MSFFPNKSTLCNTTKRRREPKGLSGVDGGDANLQQTTSSSSSFIVILNINVHNNITATRTTRKGALRRWFVIAEEGEKEE